MTHDELAFWELIVSAIICIAIAFIFVLLENRAHRRDALARDLMEYEKWKDKA